MHRAATPGDIKEIKKILSFYCLETDNVEKKLSDFKVAVLNEKIVGCAGLDVGDVVELRSIAVLPGYRNKGIGSRLLDAVLESASKLTDTVYLRTVSPGFFEKKGAVILGHEEKKMIWNDCAECDKFKICRQVLMKFNI